MKLFSKETKESLRQNLSGYDLCFYDVLESTQDECLRLYKKDSSKKWVVLANKQTQGRGRYGHTWISPPGVNLYFSFIEENLFEKEIGYLNLFYGVLLFETISYILGSLKEHLTLKWPNDLYFQDKKLAGILFQSLDNKMEKLITGIGINVYAQKEQIPEIATSLFLEKKDLKQNARSLLLENFFLQRHHGKEYTQDTTKLLDRFWLYSMGSQKQSYLYSSYFYSYKGILDKIHPDGTIDILTQDAKRVHLKT